MAQALCWRPLTDRKKKKRLTWVFLSDFLNQDSVLQLFSPSGRCSHYCVLYDLLIWLGTFKTRKGDNGGPILRATVLTLIDPLATWPKGLLAVQSGRTHRITMPFLQCADRSVVVQSISIRQQVQEGGMCSTAPNWGLELCRDHIRANTEITSSKSYSITGTRCTQSLYVSRHTLDKSN